MSWNCEEGHGKVVVGLGEALYDCFPNRRILGGAPVNLAVHVKRMLESYGGTAVAATSVGDDALGRDYVEELRERGLDTSTVQIDRCHPTGTVHVRINDRGDASYEFASDVAWDNFEFNSTWEVLASRCDAIGFGTLAQRSEKSRQTIERFLDASQHAFKLFDVNLRGEFFSASVLESSLRRASAVKLNEDELQIVCGELGLGLPGEDGLDEMAELILRTFTLSWVALTRGAKGTILYSPTGKFEGSPVAFENAADADSVGAGDACSAVLLVGQLFDWPPARMVHIANTFGAFVATQPGATPNLPKKLLSQITTNNTRFVAANSSACKLDPAT